MDEDGGIRIDKFLWAVRFFKTRSLATEACRVGKVKMNDQPLKPSHDVKSGETFSIRFGAITRTIKVKELLKNRVSAKQVLTFIDDLTPQAEYDKLKLIQENKTEFRPRGLGRPTKKERRMIDWLKRGN